MAHTTQKVFRPLAGNQPLNQLAGMRMAKTIEEANQGKAYPGPETAGTKTGKRAYIETYGCQMNFSDTEIIASVLAEMGYAFTAEETGADLILVNTCSIRENAEDKVWNRLKHWRSLKRKNPGLTVGVMGCMAERLKTRFLDEEHLVDLVVGPDAYRSLPTLLANLDEGQKAVNVLLSREETYADVSPIRLNTNGVSAFISIMRGCDNMCSFCVVPFTRGRERSRDLHSVVDETRRLFDEGYRELTLLGQNVDSYKWEGRTFAHLLEAVARVSPSLRIRFSTSHPKDMTDDVLHAMAAYENICNFIHLPVQSGNTRVLAEMKRGYTREWYLERIAAIRRIIPGCALSTDIICGFCTETEPEHQETLSLMEAVRFESAFMFYYSERPGTYAAKKLPDDVPLETKKHRLAEVIELQSRHSREANHADIGKTFRVLVEGDSKRSPDDFCGRNAQNKLIVFPKAGTGYQPGDYVDVAVLGATSATLMGELAEDKQATIQSIA